MKKKIILTATTDLSYDQRMQRIAETLSDEYEVTLVGRMKKTSISLPENLPYATIRLNTFLERGKGFYAIFNLRLFLYLIFRKADIITATDLDTLPGSYFASKLKGIKLGFDAHELFTELPELINRPRTKNIWVTIERWFVPGTDFAYTVNHSIAKLYSSKFGKVFSVVRNVPLRIIPVNEDKVVISQTKIILYQGVLNAGRGLESLIEAMDQLEGYELHLAGEGDLSLQLRKLAANLKFPERVIFHGYLIPEKLKLLTAKAWIGVNLLENISLNYYYSLANKFFDYVQAEVPQITMNFPEYQLLNQEYEVACLLENISVSEILVAVQKINDLTHFNLLKNNCRVASDIWCWENERTILIETYKQQFTR